MPRGRPHKDRLSIHPEDREVLLRLTRRPKFDNALVQRGRIVLLCAEGLSDTAVADQLQLNKSTAGKWRRRYIRRRLPGLLDEKRPGAPRRVSDEKVEEVVRATLEEAPRGAAHWTTRTMAQRTGLSHTTVGQIWRAFGLEPQRADNVKPSSDPLFTDNVRDLAGLYLDPPQGALALCVDERVQVQVLDPTQPMPPTAPGFFEHPVHDYRRNSTAALFAAFDTAAGKEIREARWRERSSGFAHFLERIHQEVPSELEVHMVMHEHGSQATPSVQRWFLRHPRFHLHLTPTYRSWINQVEHCFGILTELQIGRHTRQSVRQVEDALHLYLAVIHQNPGPFAWVQRRDQILESVPPFCL